MSYASLQNDFFHFAWLGYNYALLAPSLSSASISKPFCLGLLIRFVKKCTEGKAVEVDFPIRMYVKKGGSEIYKRTYYIACVPT